MKPTCILILLLARLTPLSARAKPLGWGRMGAVRRIPERYIDIEDCLRACAAYAISRRALFFEPNQSCLAPVKSSFGKPAVVDESPVRFVSIDTSLLPETSNHQGPL